MKHAVRYRPQRGSLAASLAEMVEIADFDGLVAQLENEGNLNIKDPREEVFVRLYFDQADPRCGWERTYLVTVRGWAVGFTDGRLD